MVMPSSSKVGIYVDASYTYLNGGHKMRYEVLREFACRDGAELLRSNAYVGYDADRAKTDRAYSQDVNRFYAILRDFGYKVIVKEVKWYEDEFGKRFGKANADLDLAVDMLLQTENLDRVLLVSGDGDFTKVVTAAQNRGCRVEVIAFDNVSADLRFEADVFVSGYLIPNLVPTSGNGAAWGEYKSRVRGICYHYNQEGHYGFMRFLNKIQRDIWLTDARHPDSPYATVYFHYSNLAPNINPDWLPSHSHIFEFDLAESTRQSGQFQAMHIELVGRMPG